MNRRQIIFRLLACSVVLALAVLAYLTCAPATKPLDDGSLPAVALMKVVADETEAEKTRFTIDFIVFRDSEHVETQLKKKHFRIDSLQQGRHAYAFKPVRVAKKRLGDPEDYAALMLMDQSGSIKNSDRHKLRLAAAKRFVDGVGMEQQLALWRFPAYRVTRGGTREYQQLVPLSNDTARLAAEIGLLAETISGGTPMYEAQLAAIRYLADSVSKPNKALLTFTDGHAARASLRDSVMEEAQRQRVRLINIGLGNPDSETLLAQAASTGGAYLFAHDAQQLISFYGNLDKLIANNAYYYHTQWEMISTDTSPRRKINHHLTVEFPFGGRLEIPFTLVRH